MALYSNSELPYCDAIASALLSDPSFRVWFCKGYPLARELADALPDAEVARQLRKVPAGDRWWFNVFSGTGAGIESDIFVVFRTPAHRRIGLHVEVKDERGRLIEGQAEGYARRVRSWADPLTRPATVPPHDEALAVLVCGEAAAVDLRTSHFCAVRRHDELREIVAGYPPASP